MEKKPKQIFPVPDIIQEDASWDILSNATAPHVNFKKRTMNIPLNDDPQWRTIRAHEMAHVAFPPVIGGPGEKHFYTKLPKGVSWLTLQAVEDYRINTLAQRAGVDFSAGAPDHLVNGALLMNKGDLKKSVLLALAVFDSQRGRVITQIMKDLRDPAFGGSEDKAEHADMLIDRAETLFEAEAGYYFDSDDSDPWSHERTIQVARWLEREFAKPSVEEQEAKRTEQKTADSRGFLSEARKTGSGKFGTMVVEFPHLIKHRVFGNGSRPTDEGVFFRQPWRVTTDYRVFNRTALPKRASILIDASSSMTFSPEDIEKIVRKVPAAIVAAYSASSDNYAGKSNHGPLRILARNGMVAVEEAFHGMPGQNIIDVPALEWLARQVGPRYWLCDGVVTGVGDKMDTLINKQVLEIARRANIIRVGNFDELMNAVKNRKR